MVDYVGLLASQLGVSVWAMIVLIIWEVIWTAVAMWKSARNNHLAWFIIFLLVNAFAIPEIVYIIWFSKKAEAKANSKTNSKAAPKRKR